ncbi:MAG: polyphosphate polymerase domain-containing protein [Oscillospiraceae bacterium]|nr:polyphosphate polymerase domain-containing protein [Oscillospiraceae bacterium]
MQYSFKRKETKYRITETQAAALERLFAQHMVLDRNKPYYIQSIYFDTVDWDVIQESIEKPLYKEKLRLRFYGKNRDSAQGFLELKKKFDGMVYKRRIVFPLHELSHRSIHDIVTADSTQIGRELDFYLQRHSVSAQIYIGYQRTAYNATAPSNLRVTLDRDVRYRLDDLDEHTPHSGQPLLTPNQVLLEIKTTEAIPLWLSAALCELQIFPIPFSKVGTCYTNHVFHRPEQKGASKSA